MRTFRVNLVSGEGENRKWDTVTVIANSFEEVAKKYPDAESIYQDSKATVIVSDEKKKEESGVLTESSIY